MDRLITWRISALVFGLGLACIWAALADETQAGQATRYEEQTISKLRVVCRLTEPAQQPYLVLASGTVPSSLTVIATNTPFNATGTPILSTPTFFVPTSTRTATVVVTGTPSRTATATATTCIKPTYGPASPTPNLQAQAKGKHSGLITNDYRPPRTGTPVDSKGMIRDNEFALQMKNKLSPNGTPSVRDAKFFFQECFGGGMLDDIATALPNVKWVGGSASTARQESLGYRDTVPNPMDFWTKVLVPELGRDQPLISAIATAIKKDPVPTPYVEIGQALVGNGGEIIRLKDPCATNHIAILWGGYADGMRHYNDIQKMRDTLASSWGTPGPNVAIQVLIGNGTAMPNGTPFPAAWDAKAASRANLKAALATITVGPNDQFLFYASDHGGVVNDKNFSTTPKAPASVELPPGGSRQDTFYPALGELRAMHDDPENVPSVAISYTGTLDNDHAVSASFNGTLLGYLQLGTTIVEFPVPENLVGQHNEVVLQSSNSTSIFIEQESFLTGSINTLSPPDCTIQFQDVPPGSTFYPWIACMACQGVISGYSDGTFRPNNSVTRGQLSKIVSNGADFDDDPGAQRFQDMAPGSTYFDFAGRLAGMGVLGGYPCGGLGEPCVSPDNRPYFRPNATATRGQIAKVVINSAISDLNWQLLNPPGNTFEDVPVGSAFFQYVETAYANGVLGGYPCGSPPAGPCIPPENKPYFLPGNNATRGQTSKIVANTFSPACVTSPAQK